MIMPLMKKIALCSLALWLLSGCGATRAMWEATDPDDMVVLSAAEVTEEELQERNIAYGVLENGEGYLVVKSDARRFGDYAIRTVATPVTVIVDGALFTVGLAATVATLGAFGYVMSHAEVPSAGG